MTIIELGRSLLHDVVDMAADTSEKVRDTAEIVVSKGADVSLNLIARTPGTVYSEGKNIMASAVTKGKEKYEVFKDANGEIGDDLGKAKDYIAEKGEQVKSFVEKKRVIFEINSLINGAKGNATVQNELKNMLKLVNEDKIESAKVLEMIQASRKQVNELHKSGKKAKPAYRPSSAQNEQIINVRPEENKLLYALKDEVEQPIENQIII